MCQTEEELLFATGCVAESFKHITFSKDGTVCYSKPCAFHMPASMRSLFAHPPPRPKCSHSESCLDVTKRCLFHLISGWLKFSTPVRTSIPVKKKTASSIRTKSVSELQIKGLWSICVRSQFKARWDLYVFMIVKCWCCKHRTWNKPARTCQNLPFLIKPLNYAHSLPLRHTQTGSDS